MSTAADTRRWMSPPQVATRLGVSADQVHAWVRSGELVGYDLSARRGGRPRLKISPEALSDFLAARQVAGPKPKAGRKKRKDWVRSWV